MCVANDGVVKISNKVHGLLVYRDKIPLNSKNPKGLTQSN